MTREASDYSAISGLLDGADLTALEWRPGPATILITFDCLRRNTDGTEIADRSVEIRMEGVTRIAAYYNPAKESKRPSEFRLKSPFTVRDLQEWSLEPTEAGLSVNSQHDRFLMDTSWRVDWLLGRGMSTGPTRDAYSIHLKPDHDYGDEDCESCLYMEGTSIGVLSGGVPLALPDWEKQCAAWWKHWEEHWRDRGEDYPEFLAEEDIWIPLAEEPSSDSGYVPPAKPAFRVERTDAPPELLAPLREFNEGHLAKAWHRMAKAWPDFDKTVEERAGQLEDQYGPGYGAWVYLRRVDYWWKEGPQACVVARGVEHGMPDEEDPAENRETVIEYALRKAPEAWVIIGYSQGWPPYGSAPRLDGPKPWLDEWDSLAQDQE